MKVLSIDVGIKNLALCVMEANENNYDILYWDIINLCEDKLYYCNCKNNTKKKEIFCTKLAQYYKNNNFYCKTHVSQSDYKLPTSTFNKIKSLKLDELINLCEDNEIIIDKKNKQEIIKKIEYYIDNNILNPISKLKCSSINLIDIGKSIKENLDKLDCINNIDYILIENQIGPIANRMNCIQGMLSQYFIMKNYDKILYISAANKLKPFLEQNKTSYNERKKISIKITKQLLINNNIDNNNKEKLIDIFDKHKKKDDLSDSFLQAIWFISKNYNKINDIINKIKNNL